MVLGEGDLEGVDLVVIAVAQGFDGATVCVSVLIFPYFLLLPAILLSWGSSSSSELLSLLLPVTTPVEEAVLGFPLCTLSHNIVSVSNTNTSFDSSAIGADTGLLSMFEEDFLESVLNPEMGKPAETSNPPYKAMY